MLKELIKCLTFLFLVLDHREGEASLVAAAGTCASVNYNVGHFGQEV